VLENKLLLLLSWDTVHTCKIHIRPGKFVYRQSTSAAICNLPIGTDSVDIILRNFWRSTKVSFRLRRITVDRQTLQYINKEFLAGLPFSINSLQPEITIPVIQLKTLHPQILPEPKVQAFNIYINQLQLNDYVP
jgi:hypothetical protein